jgi:antitoxin (DNA-binding transcriptional repressor) of toxin-antitoxin stability system
MNQETISTRRSFLKAGAVLATPMAVPAAAAIGGDPQLAEHEDKSAIRVLHQDWLRDINAGRTVALTRTGETVRRIATDHDGNADAIEVAADGKRASARFDCAVEIETALARETTLEQMAHAQGEGFVRRTERRTVAADYVKTRYGWTIARVEFATA